MIGKPVAMADLASHLKIIIECHCHPSIMINSKLFHKQIIQGSQYGVTGASDRIQI